MTKKINVDRQNCYRAILTDTLPYEIPLFFTNEKLYAEASKYFDSLPTFVKSLLTTKEATRPVVYEIQKGGGSFRRITVLHPSAQLKFAEFYGKFDSFIESACARSAFSLRYPSRVGSYYFQRQYLDEDENETESSEIDADPMSLLPQRKWASTYFSYRRYSQIYKFFSSDEFTQLEQKYRLMLKIDVARCFESIYTHSITWAVRGKEFAKEHKDRVFFESEFDKNMRNSNWGETNGIPIGPEVSRIFAEIIMQSIDLDVARLLDSNGQTLDIRRYVDDYFVFANSEDDLKRAKIAIEKCAAKFNLHLNEKKTVTTHRPLIAKLSVARSQVMFSINAFMRKARDSLDELKDEYFSSKDADFLIAEIRRISRANDTDYASLASPALAVISKKLAAIRKKIDPKTFSRRKQGNVVIESTLRLTSFLFKMDIRSATTHKISKILYEGSLIIKAIGGSMETFDGQVEDIVRSSLDLSSRTKINGPEIVNLLTAADAIGSRYRVISPAMLSQAIGCDFSNSDDVGSLGYFDLISSLYFSRNFGSFSFVRRAVIGEIEKRIIRLGNKVHLHASETMLFFDYLSCPYVSQQQRQTIFDQVGHAYGNSVTPKTAATQFGNVSSRLSFVAWSGPSQLRSMLERKELQPAYDS